MKRIGITQRVIYETRYSETRDALDQRWSKFLFECDILPVILPNDKRFLSFFVKDLSLDGFILTGGNDLKECGGKALMRDELEKNLLDLALGARLPVIGVCRGMQLIQSFYGVPVKRVMGHIASKHWIEGKHKTCTAEDREGRMGKKTLDHFWNREVWNYFEWGTKESVPSIEVLACSKDGVVQAIRHCHESILGMMWHPEREDPFFEKEDIQVFKEFLN